MQETPWCVCGHHRDDHGHPDLISDTSCEKCDCEAFVPDPEAKEASHDD